MAFPEAVLTGLIMFWRKIILFGTDDCFWWIIRIIKVLSWLIVRLRLIKMVSYGIVLVQRLLRGLSVVIISYMFLSTGLRSRLKY